ncbi:MAG: cytidylate kinase [Chloroflexus sp.]|jgi:cytidylate kinase|uniref:(d)CMP kinase n=1 Tax=Chloroflexus sp. TaxID=1904827 RepID=UPI0021DDEA09|nr:(d)CMP kinase [Chloroflexus sp.]GIV90887.1 MAG: cytidylate kinase [Chloroflexus sp.]
MRVPQTIAIDGQSAAGKSTLGALLAEALGYLYFDTGVMYRALALAALRAGIDPDDEAALSELAHRLVIDVTQPTVADGRQYTVLVNGEDVTWAIRSPEVERIVSRAARFPSVRREMVRQQQLIGQRGRVVMVGRDIGTVVMPDADLKIYLQASLAERARRRAAELRSRNIDMPLEQIAAALAERDALDAHVSQPAADAIILVNDGLTPAEEVALVLNRFVYSEQALENGH